MAEIIDKIPEIIDKIPARGGRLSYPWDEWFDGQLRKLTAGEDFSVKVHSMYAMARSAAQIRNITLLYNNIRDEHLYLQADLDD
jgi:hypothetical protein